MGGAAGPGKRQANLSVSLQVLSLCACAWLFLEIFGFLLLGFAVCILQLSPVCVVKCSNNVQLVFDTLYKEPEHERGQGNRCRARDQSIFLFRVVTVVDITRLVSPIFFSTLSNE